MSASRLPDYLDHMRQAIADAQSFVDGMPQADFMHMRPKTAPHMVIFAMYIVGHTAPQCGKAGPGCHRQKPAHRQGQGNQLIQGHPGTGTDPALLPVYRQHLPQGTHRHHTARGAQTTVTITASVAIGQRGRCQPSHQAGQLFGPGQRHSLLGPSWIASPGFHGFHAPVSFNGPMQKPARTTPHTPD